MASTIVGTLMRWNAYYFKKLLYSVVFHGYNKSISNAKEAHRYERLQTPRPDDQ
jgi:hypothetical protein